MTCELPDRNTGKAESMSCDVGLHPKAQSKKLNPMDCNGTCKSIKKIQGFQKHNFEANPGLK